MAAMAAMVAMATIAAMAVTALKKHVTLYWKCWQHIGTCHREANNVAWNWANITMSQTSWMDSWLVHLSADVSLSTPWRHRQQQCQQRWQQRQTAKVMPRQQNQGQQTWWRKQLVTFLRWQHQDGSIKMIASAWLHQDGSVGMLVLRW